MITEILNELNESNGSNHKLAVLKKHKDNELFQQVLQMTYDRVKYTYGVKLPQIMKFTGNDNHTADLQGSLIALNLLAERKVTGHAALQMCADLISILPEDDADVFKKIINRDLRINVGRTNINKVWKGLITKPVYMRCDTYGEKTSKNITFPAYIQMKADGTYREFSVSNGSVESCSRSGESYSYPKINDTLSTYEDGVYTGELTVKCSERIAELLRAELAEKIKKNKTEEVEKLEMILRTYEEKKAAGEEYILPREIGNGMINSSDVPHDELVLELWDYISHEEYARAGFKDKKNPNTTKYKDRFEKLQNIVEGSENVRIIESHEVNSLAEALQFVSTWMNQDKEGGVLKNQTGVFKDGTSKDQLKLKLKIDCEMRITGFNPGTPGTKREGKVGSLIFGNDEGTIKGRSSGFSDEELDDMTDHPEKYLNKIATFQFNDLTKASGNEYYALSHPRFIELRNDKDDTDTLEKVFELRDMAMMLK